MYTIRRKIADYLIQKKSISKMMENPVDLSQLRQRPTKRMIWGWILMAFSYVIGWPAVAALGVLAVWYKEPLIAVIGGPTIYVISCLVFILGAWLAHAPQHLGTLTKYASQAFIRKYSTKSKISCPEEN
ncbi:MAG TPA: hypothetical protein P5294_09300 [Smithellaceae bacterium]|nr:hypothetical protein [Smithellaceae bacterium]HRS88710.1 hypothetical protein [Smithellaceae bacterium]HRV26724.1 hypothetical protein [Smithellaceae bacterium]